jgi:hypothetical protein
VDWRKKRYHTSFLKFKCFSAVIGCLVKPFLVDLGIGEDGKNSDLDQVVQQQARDYQKVQQQIEDYMQVIEEAAKIDKRTVWLPILKGRHLAHLGRTGAADSSDSHSIIQKKALPFFALPAK